MSRRSMGQLLANWSSTLRRLLWRLKIIRRLLLRWNKAKQFTLFQELPIDITHNIISKLVVKDLLTLSAVSRIHNRVWSRIRPPALTGGMRTANFPKYFHKDFYEGFKEAVNLVTEGTRRSMELCCRFHNNKEALQNWIFMSTANGVSCLKIEEATIVQKLPLNYFKELHFVNCHLPSSIDLPYLEELTIKNCKFDLSWWWRKRRITIFCPKLKFLEFDGGENLGSRFVRLVSKQSERVPELVIVASHLETLILKGYDGFNYFNYDLSQIAPQSVNLDIQYSNYDHQETRKLYRIVELLNGIAKTKKLTMTLPPPSLCQDLQLLQAIQQKCNFCNLKSLHVRMTKGSEDDMSFIALIVKKSPQLSNIALEVKRVVSEEEMKALQLKISAVAAGVRIEVSATNCRDRLQ